jgi:TolB-like protein
LIRYNVKIESIQLKAYGDFQVRHLRGERPARGWRFRQNRQSIERRLPVEGEVRREGDRLRITAQLIESEEETHLWAKTFDRVMTDALSMQAELAREITKAVTDVLSATAPKAAAR